MAYPYNYGNPYAPAMMPSGYSQYPNTPPAVNPITPQAAQPQNLTDKKEMQFSIFVAPSVEYAQEYPVAPGHSVSFLIENQPYLCTKSMGFSPFDKPVFKKSKIVDEDEPETKKSEEPTPDYALKEDLEEIKERLAEVEKSLKPVPKKRAVKTEESTDE